MRDCHAALPFAHFTAPEATLGSVFISYRRADSQGEAGRLFDDLSLRFGPDSVFMDVVTIEPGRDFRKAIQGSISTCSILLAVVGQQWMDLKDSGEVRRLDDSNDLVRIEVAYALRRDIPVVPVLVRGARMPEADQLPEDLKELPYRNAVELTHARWKSDVQVLIQALTPYVETSKAVKKTPDRAQSGVGIEAAAIERVSRELATYIGPISEVVVKRAARKCLLVEDFCRMAAREIETEADRAKFLRACGQ